jgi:hypothetical protein
VSYFDGAPFVRAGAGRWYREAPDVQFASPRQCAGNYFVPTLAVRAGRAPIDADRFSRATADAPKLRADCGRLGHDAIDGYWCCERQLAEIDAPPARARVWRVGKQGYRTWCAECPCCRKRFYFWTQQYALAAVDAHVRRPAAKPTPH